MELPQPRPFGSEGKKVVHDFLSLCNHASAQQDPRPSSQGYLKTQDFLQPLEEVGKGTDKEEDTVKITAVQIPPLPVPPPSEEHLLPGGFGTYSISHISYYNQMLSKSEGSIFKVAQASSTDKNNDDNSNCSSYSGSGFSLWEESAVNKGKIEKENAGKKVVLRDRAGKMEPSTSERPLQSSSNLRNFSSLPSSMPSLQKNQSFMEMIRSAKSNGEEEDDDDEEFLIKKEECTSIKDGKSTDQKANTPRSKHSATEQRRRSKINDRFQMLRELIPHGDQKRDKASFLLEVIQYVQFLQEKVDKYEGPLQGWTNETAKLIPWSNSHKHAENFVDPSKAMNIGSVPPFTFATKLDEKNIAIIPATLNPSQRPIKSDIKVMEEHPTGPTTNKIMVHPNIMPLNPCIFTPVGIGGCTVSHIPTRLVSVVENRAAQPQVQVMQSKECKPEFAIASEKMKEQELSIEGGTISIASVYSQGLLNTLTQALQSSGVDLSQASISLQIDLGKRANKTPTSSTSGFKDSEAPSTNQAIACSRAGSSIDDSGQARKKMKSCKN